MPTSLDGGSLTTIRRKGDIANVMSIGTAGVFLARDLFKESVPYYREYNDGVLEIYITYHFLREIRRQLSGDIEEGTSTFSREEIAFWNEYQEFSEDVVKTGELLLALQTLDQWFIDEIQVIKHPRLERSYSDTHPWRKTEVRDQDEEFADDHLWNKINEREIQWP